MELTPNGSKNPQGQDWDQKKQQSKSIEQEEREEQIPGTQREEREELADEDPDEDLEKD